MGSVIDLSTKRLKPSIGIIVQARMTSVRFPGKSMAKLLDKPVLQHVLERCKLIRAAKGAKPTVVLAVPDTPESDPMLELADTLKVDNFCGSELNVLKRYYHCARYFNFNLVMRITADCPFVDPRVSSEVLQLLMWRNLDYACNCFPRRTYPKGLDTEVFTFDCLEAAYKLSDQLADHEHVTPWMQRTEGINRGNLEQQVDMSYKNWCVDYPEDIERLESEVKNKLIVPTVVSA